MNKSNTSRAEHRTLPRHRAAVALIAALGLSACAEQGMSDLERYVEQVLARQGGKIEGLPPIEPYIVYTYSSADGIDPFEPFFQEEEEPIDEPQRAQTGPRPDPNRNREELETYALDSLRMMGTLERDGATWAIVRSPDTIIHRIAVGNYIGKNHGKIIGISEDRIELKEIVPDGQGGWSERDASLALLE